MSDATPVVPHHLPDARVRRPLIEVASHRALVRFPGVGRILVTGDGDAARRPDPGRDLDDLRFLDDVVDALARLLAGQFSLRASVVEIDGAAVALCGQTPVGKSTIAMALAAVGHRFVGDSVATVAVGEAGPTVVCPRRGPVLWPDAMTRLGLDPADGVPVRSSLPTRRFAIASGPDTLPLARLVVLRRRDDSDTLQPAPGFDAVTGFVRGCWHRFAIAPLGLAADQFGWATQLAARVPVTALEVPRGDEADPYALADDILRSTARKEAPA